MSLSLLLRSAVLSSVFLGITAAESPVAKVIKLLGDLKKEVETEGSEEAKAYDKFAVFCRDSTKKKSESITKGTDNIGSLSADVIDNSATMAAKETSVKERKATHEQVGAEVTATVSRCAVSQTTYQVSSTDMAKAIESLKKAIKSMSEKKGTIKASALMQLAGKPALLLLKKKLNLDPSDPAYKYHSQEINKILANVLKESEDKKAELDSQWKTTSTACTEEKSGLQQKMKDNLDAITSAKEAISGLQKTISKTRGNLVNAQSAMQEDEAYLKDVTSQCETKAKDWDQRSAMRGDELKAVSQALSILENKVQGADTKVNKRALVQSKATVKIATTKKHVSLLQAPVKAVTNFLARQEVLSASEQQVRHQVLNLLRQEGNRLASPELSAITMRISADPFKKVQSMIQKLIEDLLAESSAEASKKGFCDQEIANANLDRDHAKQNSAKLGADLKVAEAQKEALEAEKATLKKEIAEANGELTSALDMRKKEKDANSEALLTAKAGLTALSEAILMLKSFYREAGKAVLLQTSVSQPIEGPGFSGAYQGKQSGSNAVMALLENISADFERTIRKTQQSEETAAADFVKLDRAAKAEIASKETKTKLDDQDLKSTNTDILKTLDDLKLSAGLLDDSLKIIEELKPTCLDPGGMNYKERTAKRNEEVAALKKALELLAAK